MVFSCALGHEVKPLWPSAFQFCCPARNAWYTHVHLSTPQNMKDVLEKKNCRGGKKVSDWTQRLYLCICGSSVICCQNKLAPVRCTFFLCSAHPLKMKILSSILSFELSSGGCGFRQTPAMCVILNWSHRLYSPMLFWERHVKVLLTANISSCVSVISVTHSQIHWTFITFWGGCHLFKARVWSSCLPVTHITSNRSLPPKLL